MIKKCSEEDISNIELENVINPFYDNYHEFIVSYVMPEVIAFYLASSYSRNAMWEATFLQHYNSAKDIFNIDNRKNIMCEEAGVKQIRIHDFRHSCASLLINNGATIPTVSKFLGHTKIEETLNTYTHLFGSALNEVVDLINKLDDKS